MRVLVTGAGGQLGASLEAALVGHEAIMLDHLALDVTDDDAVWDAVENARPDVIVHAAAWTDVDGCEQDPARARRVNVDGTRNVAESCGDAFVIVVGTDYVFDGASDRAYTEEDLTNPLQVYGATKLDGESVARVLAPRVAVARTAWLYGRGRNFVASIVRAASKGPIDVVDDQVGSPTSCDDLAVALVRLAEAQTPGLFHVANTGAVSRHAFARAIASHAGIDPERIRAVSTAEAPPRPAVRPAYAPLDGVAWRAAGFSDLPPWEDALARAIPAVLETV